MPRLPSAMVLSLTLCFALSAGCGKDYGGSDNSPPEECGPVAAGEEAAVGCPGGFCLAPDGWCVEGECLLEAAVCYDPAIACRGFTCGEAGAGVCVADDVTGLPKCLCAAGYINTMYAYYCEPE